MYKNNIFNQKFLYTKLLLVFMLSLAIAFGFNKPIFADTPSNAGQYCTQDHSTGSPGWQECVDRIQNQLDACADTWPVGTSDYTRCTQAILSGDTASQDGSSIDEQLVACDQAFSTGTSSWQQCRSEVISGISPGSGSGETSSVETDCEERPLNRENCGIINFIWIITDGLSVLVGIVVVMTLVIGGIEYSAAGSNPQAVMRAKKHISRALLALVAYVFMYAILQWLIPGGVFS